MLHDITPYHTSLHITALLHTAHYSITEYDIAESIHQTNNTTIMTKTKTRTLPIWTTLNKISIVCNWMQFWRKINTPKKVINSSFPTRMYNKMRSIASFCAVFLPSNLSLYLFLFATFPTSHSLIFSYSFLFIQSLISFLIFFSLFHIFPYSFSSFPFLLHILLLHAALHYTPLSLHTIEFDRVYRF